MKKQNKKERFPKSVRYYSDTECDFVPEVKGEKSIGRDYKYIHKNIFWKIGAFFLYRVIATPIAFIYTKLFLRERYIGRKKLKGHKSYILYLTHNEQIADALTPSFVAFPKRTYVVVHPDNVLVPVVGRLTPMLGALPTPSDLRAARNFSLAVQEHLDRGSVVAVYPEAHVWQKCGFVRPFQDTAFDMAVKSGGPAFAVTRTYKRHKLFGYCTRTYIDGPFYADATLPRGEAARRLSAQIREVMCARAKEHNEIDIIRYIKKGEHQDESDR